MRFDKTFGVPFAVHRGTSDINPSMCDCSKTYNPADSSQCNMFNFIIGAIVWKSNGKEKNLFETFLPTLEFFYQGEGYDASQIMTDVYNATWASAFAQQNKNGFYSTNKNWRASAYSFLNSSIGYGTIIQVLSVY